ncbi:MAG: phosphodiester glycosidase family protein [Treponema sp.]|nr:phosphodiester glycosidase family protein [Candidatus Treponema caballi]
MNITQPLRKKRAAFVFTALLLAAFSLSGCATIRSAGAPLSYNEVSSETVLVSAATLHPAITVETYRNENYPLTYHLVTVDLSDSSISLVSAPLLAASSADSAESVCVTGETTQSFAQRTGAIVAINATPFSIPGNKPLFMTSRRLFTGLVIEDGTQLSAPEERYGALGFTKDNTAFIMESQTEPLPEDTVSVLGGFWIILKDGKHTDDFADIQNSRTAAGISADGKTLFLLSVEGERSASSRGLNYYDCAEILKKAGARSAIQLDGGGSTSLIIQGNNKLSYSKKRAVANNFGICVTISID